jgi:ribosomal-protein-alanine N-acetyltransferase
MDVMEDSFDPCFGEGWTAPQCAGLLPMPGVWLTMARIEHDVVGFALARIVLDEAELLLLAVKKHWQHRGIGQELLDSFIGSAAERGARKLHLEVREGNHAINLYKYAGFSEIGRRKAYYSGRDGQTFDALTLARPS